MHDQGQVMPERARQKWWLMGQRSNLIHAFPEFQGRRSVEHAVYHKSTNANFDFRPIAGILTLLFTKCQSRMDFTSNDEMLRYCSSSGRAYVSFSFKQAGRDMGSVVLELFTDIAPATCANFLKHIKATSRGYKVGAETRAPVRVHGHAAPPRGLSRSGRPSTSQPGHIPDRQ